MGLQLNLYGSLVNIYCEQCEQSPNTKKKVKSSNDDQSKCLCVYYWRKWIRIMTKKIPFNQIWTNFNVFALQKKSLLNNQGHGPNEIQRENDMKQK